MMLVHLNESETANLIRNALYKTIEEGIHTPDIYNEKTSQKKVGTQDFTNQIIKNLGKKPETLSLANYQNYQKSNISNSLTLEKSVSDKSLIGFDLFIDWQESFENLLTFLKKMESEKFELKMISSMGLLLWPLIDQNSFPNFNKGLTILRFIGKGISGKSSNDIINPNIKISNLDIIDLLKYLNDQKIEFVKYEGLYLFDNKPAFSSGQGE
jgi:isocitrate dehydrogenase